MANEHIEIEIKISLDENSFFKVKEKLKKIARFEKISKQIDEYFTPAHRNFVDPEIPLEWLSIRKRGDKNILNYKHWYLLGKSQIATHCDEFETEVKDSGQLKKIFSVLDFKKLITVEKEREIYVYRDEFEVALDKVKELGLFIEIEAIKDIGSIEETRKKLFEFAENIGIDISKTDKRGYPYLLMKKKGLIKR